MAVTENIVSKKYRILVDAANRTWNRISFWTQAKDVFNDNGGNLQDTVGWVKGRADNINITQPGYIPDTTIIKNMYTEINQNIATEHSSIFNFGTTAMNNGDPLTSGHFYWQYKA